MLYKEQLTSLFKHFYLHLINVDGLALGTLDSVYCVLHPTFELAVRDDIIRKNPSDGVMREISKKSGKNRGIRRALTPEQQRASSGVVEKILLHKQ